MGHASNHQFTRDWTGTTEAEEKGLVVFGNDHYHANTLSALTRDAECTGSALCLANLMSDYR
eukprot:scaffold304_cov190-Ochromonas_danica.AAC.2